MRLTQKRADELLSKIDRYAKTKENNIFDAFYHADLDVFSKLIKAATMTPEEEEALHTQKEKKAEETEQPVASITPFDTP